MGETRPKRQSKRNLKAQHHKGLANGKPPAPSSEPLVEVSPTLSTFDQLCVPTPSKRSSKSSLRSSQHSTPETAPFDSRSSIRVHQVDGRGFCLFATRSIPKGALVLAEIPIIRLTSEDENDYDQAEDMIRLKFDRLDKSSKKSYRKLHDARKDGFSKLRSIYHTNCYNLAGSRSDFGGSCVALTASRINHSCVPNVQFSFLEEVPAGLVSQAQVHCDSDGVDVAETRAHGTEGKMGVMLFYAIKRIQKGHEIVSNYESVYLTSQQRMYKMRLFYGFTCNCKACASPDNAFWSKSDERRREMVRCRRVVAEAEQKWREHHSKDAREDTSIGQLRNLSIEDAGITLDILSTVKALETLVELLELEGLAGIELVDTHHKLVRWLVRAGPEYVRDVAKWLRLERESALTAFGPFSKKLKDIDERPLNQLSYLATTCDCIGQTA